MPVFMIKTMTNIHKAEKSPLRLLISAILSISMVLAICLSASSYATEEAFDKGQLQSELNHVNFKIDQLTSSSEAESLRIALNDLILKLRDCDKDTQQKLDAYQLVRGASGKSVSGKGESGITESGNLSSSIVSGVSTDSLTTSPTSANKRASSPNQKSNNLELAESNLQKRLVECKYLLLQATQSKEKLLILSTELQLSNYFTQKPFYWRNDNNADDHIMPESHGDILTSILFTLFVLLVLGLTIKNTSFFMRYYPVLINTFLTLIIVSVAVYWHNIKFDLNLDIAWILATSMMLPISIHFYTRQSLFYHFVAACFVIIGSTLLISESSILDSKLFHGAVYISLVLGLLLIASKSYRRTSSYFVGSIIALLLLLEGLEFHTLAHLSLIWLTSAFVLINVHRLVKLCIEAGGKIVKMYFESTHNMPFMRDSSFTESLDETPGIKWISGSLYITLISLLLFNILPILGLPHWLIESFQSAFIDGIQVGTVELNAKNILIASFIFGVILFVSWIIKGLIETSFGRSVSQKQSAQIAKASLFWYAAILTAALVALSISGFEVQNLAIIAGAFSVGIGFGLQNIVSNFVSGLILLIERPVKPGDWVVIGNTEGLIQRINIRATQITTFDRSDILVPNSELVSNQVTNLMLGDSVGRLKFNVGVAYGSDTEKVAAILLAIVKEHREVITEDKDVQPSIALIRFGDSSVDFEVRCFLKDIKQIVVVRSDLLHAIYKAFKANNIEIPFPQRDIYIKRMVDGRKNVKQEDDDDKPE